jgi:hypothetical protein
VSGEITPGEIRTGEQYESVRSESRRGVAEMQRHRRVQLGELLSLVFENRESIRSVIEEVVRAERLTRPPEIAREVEAFSPLVPSEGELCAALYVEVADPARLSEELERLTGVERGVYLEVAGSRAQGVAHPAGAAEEAPSAHYLGFTLSAEQRRACLAGEPVAVGVEHPAVQARVELDVAQREAIVQDLRSAAG